MIVKTDFQRSGVGDLISYICWDGGEKVPVRDHSGREMGDEDLDRFVDASRKYGFERHLIVSPSNRDELSKQRLSLCTRRLMREFLEDRPSGRYCYSIHEKRQEGRHVHIALTGKELDLRLDREDLRWLRREGREKFKEKKWEKNKQKTKQSRLEYEKGNQRDMG